MKNEKAIAVVRVSTSKQQITGDSPEDQKEQIERYIQYNNITITKWFEYAESASKEKQPLQGAVDYCKVHQGEIKYLLVKSIDRFTRGGAFYYGLLKSQLAKYGVSVVDVYGVIGKQEINTLQHLGIKYSWSTFSPTYTSELLTAERGKDEIRDILTRLIGSSIRYNQMGYHSRPAPPGYINIRIDSPQGKRTVLAPHPQESPYFILMFELRAQGNMSDLEIVAELNSRGYKSRRQYIRSHEDRNRIIGTRGEKPLTVKQLQRFIQNPIYAGVEMGKWTNSKPVKGQYDGLISNDLFNKANRGKAEIISEDGVIKFYKGKVPNWQAVKNKKNPNYPWKECFRCPHCGGQLRASASKGKSGKYYGAYHCSKGHKYYRVYDKRIDEEVEKFANSVEFSPEFREKFKKVLLEELEKRQEQVTDRAISFEERVLELQNERKLTVEKIKQVSSSIAVKALEEDLERIEMEYAEAVRNRDNHEDEQLNIQTVINQCLYFMEHPRDLLIGSLNWQQNAAMFSLLFDQTPTYEELKSGTPKLCPLFQLKEAYASSEEDLVRRLGLEPRTLSLKG